jgi:cell division protein FtsB
MAVVRVTLLVRYLALLTLLAVALGWVLFYGTGGFVDYLDLKRDKDRMSVVLLKARDQNRDLYTRVERLREDPAYIEKTAREELGMVRQGEVVYRFKEPLTKDNPENRTDAPGATPPSGADSADMP